MFSRLDPRNLERVTANGGNVTLYVRLRTARTLQAAKELNRLFPGLNFVVLPADWYRPETDQGVGSNAAPGAAHGGASGAGLLVHPAFGAAAGRGVAPAPGLGVSYETLKAVLEGFGFDYKKPERDPVKKGWFSLTGYSTDLAADVNLAGPTANAVAVRFGVTLDRESATARKLLVALLRTVFHRDGEFERRVRPWLVGTLDRMAAPARLDAALETATARIELSELVLPDRRRRLSLSVEAKPAKRTAPAGQTAPTGPAQQTLPAESAEPSEQTIPTGPARHTGRASQAPQASASAGRPLVSAAQRPVAAQPLP